MTLTLDSIYIYPVKSCGAIKLTSWDMTNCGLALDRIFVLIDNNNKFITGRAFPKLSLVYQSLIEENGKTLIKLEYEDFEPLILDPKPNSYGPEIEVMIWEDLAHGHDVGEKAANWFSKVLNQEAKLLLKSEKTRKVRDSYLERDGLGHINSETGFADGFPLLITSKESIQSLKNELPSGVSGTVGSLNFRPNLIVSGLSAPFEEDTFGKIKIGQVELHCDLPCARCSFPNVNPETGIAHPTEPSKTLMKVRRSYKHIKKFNSFFGINAIPITTGKLEINTPIEVLTRSEK